MAAKSKKSLRENIKAKYTQTLIDFFQSQDEEVLRIKSNEICFPVVDEEGNEEFVKITIAVPTGSREDNEPFDGYSKAEEYEINQRLKAEKAEKAAKKKAEKIKRDKEYREKKAQIKRREG
jgi:hypothetical protein